MICIFIRSLTKGGAEKQSLILARLLKKKYKVLFVVFYGNQIDESYLNFITNEKIKIIGLQGNFFIKLNYFYKLLKKYKIRIIFTYLLTDNLVGAVIGKIAGGIFVVGGIRNSYLPLSKLIISRFLNIYLQDFTIFNNESGRILFIEKYGFKKKNSITIQNCYDSLPNNSSVKLKKDMVSILTVGRFVKQKDYITFLNSVRELKEKYSLKYNIIFYIIGYGKLEKYIRQKVQDFEISELVQIIIKPIDINQYYENSDIYFSTSLFEGLSNSIMEAMAFSLPIIATNVGDNKYLVKNNFNGFLFKKLDYQKAAYYLSVLINSYNLRVKMGKNSLKHLKYNYSKEKFLNKYDLLVKSLLR